MCIWERARHILATVAIANGIRGLSLRFLKRKEAAMKRYLLTPIIVFFSFSTLAQDRSAQREFSSEVKNFRSETRDSLRLFRFERRLLAKPTVEWELTVGAAYTDGDDSSKTWNTPFEIAAKWNEGATKLKLLGDGYARTNDGEDTVNGMSDILVTLSHRLKQWEKKASLTGSATLLVPTAGEVGTRTAQQRLGLSYFSKLDDSWAMGGRVSGRHYNTVFKPGVRSTSVSGAANVAYTIDDDRALAMEISRGYRRGSGGSSQLLGSFEFPASQSVGATFSLGRGLTKGARDSSAELDFTFTFP